MTVAPTLTTQVGPWMRVNAGGPFAGASAPRSNVVRSATTIPAVRDVRGNPGRKAEWRSEDDK